MLEISEYSESAKKEIKETETLFYKKALSKKRPKEIWKTIYQILNPSQTWVKENKTNQKIISTQQLHDLLMENVSHQGN